MNIVKKVENYLKKYVTFSEDHFALVAALWVIGTHCFQEFDTFPYLTITAATKRAGKSTLKDLLIPISFNGRSLSADSPASMFRPLEKTEGEDVIVFPTMFVEEAEKLAAENHPAREFLNKGYQKGDVITRWINGKVVEFECFCPKCFILIGDVLDTLKDRSIPVIMRRRSAIEASNSVRVRMSEKKLEAESVYGEIKAAVRDALEDIRDHYATFEALPFLGERDEQLFQPLFSMLTIFDPDRVEEFKRVATDVTMEKEIDRKAIGTEWENAEKKADDEEARVLLLLDMISLIGDDSCLGSSDLLERLKEIPTAKWRKFRGKGLTTIDMGNLLDSLNVHPVVIRRKGSNNRKGHNSGDTFRGYRREQLMAAATLIGLKGESK